MKKEKYKIKKMNKKELEKIRSELWGKYFDVCGLYFKKQRVRPSVKVQTELALEAMAKVYSLYSNIHEKL